MRSKDNAIPAAFSSPCISPRWAAAASVLTVCASLLPSAMASAAGRVIITGKVRSAKISMVPPNGGPASVVNIVYTAQAISSYPRGIPARRLIAIKGTRTVSMFGGLGGPCLEPVMFRGARFVAEITPTRTNGTYSFACPTLLPNGMAVPFPVAPMEIPAVKEGLRVWAEAEKSGFNVGSPYPNILPLAQARQLMKSHNYYVWALGISSYCAGANANTMLSLISRTFRAMNRLVPLRMPDGTIRQVPCHDLSAFSTRRAAWLVYAMATFPPRRRNRITAHYAARLIASVLYYRRTAFGKDFLPAWGAVWANPIRAFQKRRNPQLPKWATKISYSAPVAAFLRSEDHLHHGEKLPPAPAKREK